MSETFTAYTVPQTAMALAVSRATIYRLIDDGALECVRVRSKIRVRPNAIKRYLDHLERNARERAVGFQ